MASKNEKTIVSPTSPNETTTFSPTSHKITTIVSPKPHSMTNSFLSFIGSPMFWAPALAAIILIIIFVVVCYKLKKKTSNLVDLSSRSNNDPVPSVFQWTEHDDDLRKDSAPHSDKIRRYIERKTQPFRSFSDHCSKRVSKEFYEELKQLSQKNSKVSQKERGESLEK